MEVPQPLRELVKQNGLDTEEAVAAGLPSKCHAFADAGGEIYS
jgi:hypothetical protein